MSDRSPNAEPSGRAPWVEPAPRPLGLVIFWLAMVSLVAGMAAVITVVGFEDENTVRAAPEESVPTTEAPTSARDDLDVILSLLALPASDRDRAREDAQADPVGDVLAVDHLDRGTSPPDSAGRVDLIDYGSFSFQADERRADAFGNAGRLSCGSLGTEGTTDWSMQCVRTAPGSGLATPGPVLVVWGTTRLRLAEPGTSASLCVGTLGGAVEAAVVIDEPNVVRTLELQVRGGVDPRSMRVLRAGELWAFLIPVTEQAPAWRLSATQVTAGAISTDDAGPGGPPPAPPRADGCRGDVLAPPELVIPTTTTTEPPATTTTIAETTTTTEPVATTLPPPPPPPPPSPPPRPQPPPGQGPDGGGGRDSVR